VERIASDVDELRRDIWEERETNDRYLQHMVSFVDQLKTKLADVECSLHRHEQKSLRCNLEMEGFPDGLDEHEEVLKRIVVGIAEKLDVKCSSEQIRHVYRSTTTTTITTTTTSSQKNALVVVEFHDGRKRDEILSHFKKFRTSKMRLSIGVGGETTDALCCSVDIRPNMCAYYRNLFHNCTLLRTDGVIRSADILGTGFVSITKKDGDVMTIFHETTILQMFPNFKRFSFS